MNSFFRARLLPTGSSVVRASRSEATSLETSFDLARKFRFLISFSFSSSSDASSTATSSTSTSSACGSSTLGTGEATTGSGILTCSILTGDSPDAAASARDLLSAAIRLPSRMSRTENAVAVFSFEVTGFSLVGVLALTVAEAAADWTSRSRSLSVILPNIMSGSISGSMYLGISGAGCSTAAGRTGVWITDGDSTGA